MANGLIDLPGVVVEDDAGQFLPALSENPMYAVSPEVAQQRAEKYSFAMSDDPENPGVDTLRGAILNGQEGIERQRAATRKAIRNQGVRQQMVREFIANTPKMTPADLDLIQSLSDEAVENPNTVLEKELAEKLAQRIAVQSTSFSGSQEDHQVMDAFTNIHARKEIGLKQVEDLEAEWKNTGWGTGILTYAEQLIPFKSWYNIQNAVKAAPQTSFLPGNNLQEQISYLQSLPPDQFESQLKTALADIKSRNMVDAINFARAVTAYTTTDQFLDNSLGIADLSVLAPGIGLVPYRTTARFASTLKEVAKASGNRTTTVPEILEAAGHTGEAAQELAWRKVQERAAMTHSPNSVEALKGEVPSIADPSKILTGTGNSLSREQNQYLQNFLENQGAKLIQETVLDPVEVTRISPGSAAWDVMMEEANRLRKMQYHTLNEAVLDVVPINGGLGNTNHLGIRFGTHPLDEAVAESKNLPGTSDLIATRMGEPGTAQLFGSEDAADLVAKELYGFKNYTIGKQGDGYYIQVTKAVNELSPTVLTQLQQETANATPRGVANTMLGWIRSPADTLPPDLYKEMVGATYGGSKMNILFRSIQEASFNALPKFRSDSRKNFLDFVDYQRSVIPKGETVPGKFSKTQGDFEQEWTARFGKTPTFDESKAYWTYVQLNDIDWTLRNLTMYRAKAMTGHEMFSLPIAGIKPKPGVDPHVIEGVLVDKLPWDSKDSFKIVVWDEKTDQIRRGYSKYMPAGERDALGKLKPHPEGKLTRGDIEDLGKNYKIIQLSRYGKQAIKDLPLGTDTPERILGKGAIDFVLVKKSTSKPLEFAQIPYKPGGHIEYKQGYFVRQPHIVQAGTKLTPEYQYYGDKTIWHFETETQAKKFTERAEKARQMRLAGDAGLETYLAKNLGMSVKSFEELFTKHLDEAIPIGYTKSGSTMKETYALQQKYANFKDINDNAFDTYKGNVNLQYASERGQQINTIRQLGTETDPIFKYEPAKLLDPMATMSRAANNMMKGRYLEDLKATAAQRFIAEFGDLLGLDRQQIGRDTYKHLLDPKWIATTDRDRLAAAKNYRRATIEFLGMKNETQRDTIFTKQKLLDSIYEKFGDKAYTIVEPYLMHRLTDPVQFMRAAAFHTKLGLFNISQFFLQANTMAWIIALDGPVAGGKAFSQMMSARWARFTDQPGVLNALAKQAGMRSDHFKESVEAYRRTGMDVVGGEIAYLDDFLEQNTVRGATGKFLDWGRRFFDEGERIVRETAWHAAYNRWRTANPTARLNDEAIKDIVARADTLTVNMTRSANAMWQKGAISIPTQFFSYQVRMMEQMLGKRLTGYEKMRAFGTMSALYGVPVATGMATALYPWHEDIRQKLLERGIDTDANMITKVLNDGMISPMLEFITDEKWNYGERYGPGGVSFMKDMLDSKSARELIAGVSGKTVYDTIQFLEPFGTAIMNTMRDDDTYYPLSMRDFYTPAIDAVSGASGLRKIWNAVAEGKYITKNGTVVADVDGAKGTFMWLTSMSPQSVSDAYRMIESGKELKKYQDEEKKDAIKYYRLGYAEKDPDKQLEYFKKAKVHIVRGMFQPDQVANVISESFKGHETLVDSVAAKFARQSPERLQAWINKQKNRNQ